MPRTAYGDRLRQWRKERHHSLLVYQERLGINIAEGSRVERGDPPFTEEQLRKLLSDSPELVEELLRLTEIRGTDCPVCPYCGDEQREYLTQYHADAVDESGTCDECGRDFLYSVQVTTTFSTKGK